MSSKPVAVAIPSSKSTGRLPCDSSDLRKDILPQHTRGSNRGVIVRDKGPLSFWDDALAVCDRRDALGLNRRKPKCWTPHMQFEYHLR